MKYLVKNFVPDSQGVVRFTDRGGSKVAFNVANINPLIAPVIVNGTEFKAGIAISNGDFPEIYPCNANTQGDGFYEITSVDIVEVVYDLQQELCFMSDSQVTVDS